ncbi:FtsX-like permease family protein [bacterium]|nr:FtsX-like permease family protein [bacterium]
MKILFNHTLRSIKSNPGQFFVITLTIIVITCMLFVSLTVGDLFYNLQLSLNSRIGKEADVKLEGIFSEARLNEFYAENSSSIKYIDTYMQYGGLFRNFYSEDSLSKVILIEATNLRDFYERHKDTLTLYEYYEFSYQYPEVWVGKSFAQENNLKAGDTVEIYLEYTKSYQKMTVSYIFENFGMFANSVVNNVMVDFSTVSSRGILTTAYFALESGVDKDLFMSALSSFMNNTELKISPAVDFENINRVVSNNQQLLNVALVFIIALILFILFTSYLVVAKSRLNELVTFKTAGATNMQLVLIMLFEGVFYGVVGAVIGLILGRAGMALAASMVIPNFPDAVQYKVTDYFISFLLGIVISVAAAIIPSIRASRDSVRSLLTGSVKEVKKPPFILVPLAVLLTAGCVLLIVFVPNISVIVLIMLLIIMAVLIMMVMPYVINGISYLFKKSKGSSQIAFFSVKRNSFNQTLSGLIGSVMVFTFLVVSIINVIVFALKPYNERFQSDFVIESVDNTDLKTTATEIENVHGVKNTYYYGYDTFIWQKGNLNQEYLVYGVDSASAVEYISEGVSASSLEAFSNTVNPVIVSYDLIQRFDLKINDKITLDIGDKNSGAKYTLYGEFTIVGIDYAMTKNDRVMIIFNDSFVVDRELYSPKGKMVFVLTDKNVPSKDLYYDLRDRLQGTGYILDYNDWAYATSVGITGVITLLNILQIMISLVAFIGIINLTIVSRLERNREFNIYRSVGMDKKGFSALSACEGLIIGLSGGVIGFFMSVVLNRLMPTFAIMIDRYLVGSIVPLSIPIIILSAMVLYMIAYFVVAISNKRKAEIERNIL